MASLRLDHQFQYADVIAKFQSQYPVHLARHSDFYFVTLAASAATRHIVSREVIEAVGPEGMIVNVSRA